MLKITQLFIPHNGELLNRASCLYICYGLYYNNIDTIDALDQFNGILQRQIDKSIYENNQYNKNV